RRWAGRPPPRRWPRSWTPPPPDGLLRWRPEAAAHLPAGAPRSVPGPPLRPQGCSASPAATALRAGLDSGDLCDPWAAAIKGQAQGPAPPRARHPSRRSPHIVNTERVIYRHCCNDPLSPSALEPGFHDVPAGSERGVLEPVGEQGVLAEDLDTRGGGRQAAGQDEQQADGGTADRDV